MLSVANCRIISLLNSSQAVLLHFLNETTLNWASITSLLLSIENTLLPYRTVQLSTDELLKRPNKNYFITISLSLISFQRNYYSIISMKKMWWKHFTSKNCISYKLTQSYKLKANIIFCLYFYYSTANLLFIIYIYF